MKLNKLKTIKGYKSFKHFEWQRYFNALTFHDQLNLVYGENGSGKSSICNILKSVSQNKQFQPYSPEEIELETDSDSYQYLRSNSWDKLIPKDSFLFFDREFVDRHIHLGHDRGSQQGEQEQESGKLIIEFDAEAIRLRDEVKRLEGEKTAAENSLNSFRTTNSRSLNFALDEAEQRLFEQFKDKIEVDIASELNSLNSKRAELNEQLTLDLDLQKKTDSIRKIQTLQNIDATFRLSGLTHYQELFSFDLKEQTKETADAVLTDRITRHKDFFQTGFEIRKDHPDQCPFCQSTGEEVSIKHILSVYNDIYDDSYQRQAAIFGSNKRQLANELTDLLDTTFDLDGMFISLKNLSDQYKIPGIYNVSEEQQFRKQVSMEGIRLLKDKVETMPIPSGEQISEQYASAESDCQTITQYASELSNYVKVKNSLIDQFKRDNTDTKLLERIQSAKTTIRDIDQITTFLRSGKIAQKKDAIKKREEVKRFEHELETIKTTSKKAKENYEQYCSTAAFNKVLEKMGEYFDRFSFPFRLQLDPNRRTDLAKELPFAFKVLDPAGSEREFKEGLSEGELQVLSLSFFFAFLEIQDNKREKVLIFDDPITSLDDSNLSALVDLIAEEYSKFSQVFVFTHHRTFLKFLRKRFKDISNEYVILRNKDELGGSFLCRGREQMFVDRLRNFETHLVNLAQNPNGFDLELQIVEYGQYLRYEIENLIKCKLLHWNKAEKFADVVDGLKKTKAVTDVDLDEIKGIYSFCNWTTAHVDVDNDHGLSQLKDKIARFIAVYDKIQT